MNDMAGVAAAGPQVVYRGRGSLVGLLLRNLGLNIVTLGFYRFWARTRLRRYLWGNVEVLGDPLAYTGTGMELFKGFLVALCVLVPAAALYAGLQFLLAGRTGALVAATAVFYLAAYVLIQMAVFLARRYRLGRTTWRGIRFGQTGSVWRYTALSIGWTLATVVTLGLAAPWGAMARRRYLMEHTLFGDRPFAFSGTGRPLFGKWLLALVLLPFTFGLTWIWYTAQEFRYAVSCTTLGPVGARSDVKAGAFIGRLFLLMGAVFCLITAVGIVTAIVVAVAGLKVTNPQVIGGVATAINFGMIIVFGPVLSWTILYVPLLRHVCATLTLTSPEALTDITQSTLPTDSRGEGLADAFDIGLG